MPCGAIGLYRHGHSAGLSDGSVGARHIERPVVRRRFTMNTLRSIWAGVSAQCPRLRRTHGDKQACSANDQESAIPWREALRHDLSSHSSPGTAMGRERSSASRPRAAIGRAPPTIAFVIHDVKDPLASDTISNAPTQPSSIRASAGIWFS
jgi:hypothetical protein